jgi:hypothetical protein
LQCGRIAAARRGIRARFGSGGRLQLVVRPSCAGLNSPGRQALRKGRCDEHGQPHRR